MERGERENSLEIFNKVLNIFKEIYEKNPENLIYKFGISNSYLKLYESYFDINIEKSKFFLMEGIRINEEIVQKNPQNIVFKNQLNDAKLELKNYKK